MARHPFEALAARGDGRELWLDVARSLHQLDTPLAHRLAQHAAAFLREAFEVPAPEDGGALGLMKQWCDALLLPPQMLDDCPPPPPPATAPAPVLDLAAAPASALELVAEAAAQYLTQEDNNLPAFEDEDGACVHDLQPTSYAPPPPPLLPALPPLLPPINSAAPLPQFQPRKRARVHHQDNGRDRDEPDAAAALAPAPPAAPALPVIRWQSTRHAGRPGSRVREPHSPHCVEGDAALNRRFLCIYPHTLDARSAAAGGHQCGADFTTRQACQNHIRAQHTHEKLACPHCGKGFSDRQNLGKHEREVHRKELAAANPRTRAPAAAAATTTASR